MPWLPRPACKWNLAAAPWECRCAWAAADLLCSLCELFRRVVALAHLYVQFVGKGTKARPLPTFQSRVDEGGIIEVLV